MSRLRPSASSLSQPPASHTRPLRIIASGTLFLTHALSLPHHPAPSGTVRAHEYTRTRNGSASTILAVLAQFRALALDAGAGGGGGIEGCWLVASLGGNDEGKEVIRELDRIGVNTRYCKIWETAGVPGAWVLHANDTDSQSVINHNPLPDITHEEFVSLLGPLLAPENYPPPAPSLPSPPLQPNFPPRPSLSAPSPGVPAPLNGPAGQPQSPAPFDWLHFEGRSVKTTLNNIAGIDGLARERRWRAHCVFSVDVGRRARQGVEALIPHADVVFLNSHYARAHSPAYATTPRAFLLSLAALAAPHALLVAHWGRDGAAVLSVPTREYFQSSGWAADDPRVHAHAHQPPSPRSVRAEGAPHGHAHGHEREHEHGHADEALSVRSGSDFWASPGARRTPSTASAFSAAYLSSSGHGHEHGQLSPRREQRERERDHGHDRRRRGAREHGDGDGDSDVDSDADSQGTEIAGSSHGAAHAPHQQHRAGDARSAANSREEEGAWDEVGAQDAFVAGMIYALSRRLLPGAPYSPGLGAAGGGTGGGAGVGGGEEGRRWRLDECLR